MRVETERGGITYDFSWLDRVNPDKALLRGRAYWAAKRVMDVLLVALSLPITLPLLALCALAIKIDSPRDPVIFLQRRTGQGGRAFRMYKFRTMVVNAEGMKAALKNFNELRWPDFKIANDPRTTGIGRILRRTSLDELPQIFNVLRGEMSIVGPRPTSFSSDTYALWQTERLDVRPGITGLWQLAGRSSAEFSDRLRLDIAYIEKRSLWLDIEILLRTIPAVLSQRGAY